jgi:predicted peroxiredoxin
MIKRLLIAVLALAGLLLGWVGSQAQEGKGKGPDWKYALELRVRKAGEEEFTKDTKKYGVEVYQDDNGGHGIHLSETGAVAVVPGKLFKSAEGKIKDPKWQHGLSLACRKADEKEFTKATRRFGLEIFKDENNGDLIYASETGQIDAVAAKFAAITAEGKPKTPTWKHAMTVKVRKAGEKDFTKDTKKYGIEIFKDENNGNLVYISETGSIAVAAGKQMDKDQTGKGPEWKHGMELAVRKAGEKEFGKDTKKWGIEVFADENNANLIYIGENGSIAVVPGRLAKPTPAESRGPEWKHAMELSARKAGEKEFTKDTKKYGIEVYADENNGNLIYISETGDMSVVVPGAN